VSAAVLYYVGNLLTYFSANVLLVLGLNIQFGLAGVINFSYYMLVAAGGYTAALTAIGPTTPADAGVIQYIGGWTLPWPIPVVLAGLVGAAVAVAVAHLAVRRLRSDYLAIATLVVGEAAWTLTGNHTGFLNGWQGLSGVTQPFLATSLSPVAASALFCGVVLVVAAAGFVVAERVARSPFGRSLRAIRENEETAAALGKDVFALRLRAVIVGGVLAAVGGALFIEYIGSVSPGLWAVPETFVLYTALIVGGTGNNWGAALGAGLVPVAFLEATRFIPPIANNPDIVATLRWIVIGAVGIAILYYRPQGVLPERQPRYPPPGRPAETAAGTEVPS
jgi:branched-chain amino acid transport system permease protein